MGMWTELIPIYLLSLPYQLKFDQELVSDAVSSKTHRTCGVRWSFPHQVCFVYSGKTTRPSLCPLCLLEAIINVE